jgi:hypothetical protein
MSAITSDFGSGTPRRSAAAAGRNERIIIADATTIVVNFPCIDPIKSASGRCHPRYDEFVYSETSIIEQKAKSIKDQDRVNL